MAADFASESSVHGLLLCRAGPHRLAFLAQQVTSIAARTAVPCPHARQAYALPPVEGRVLFTDAGPALTVDALEISQESLPLLPAPPLVAGQAGGSICGFVSNAEGLWPVLFLADFSRFLGGAGG